MDASFRFNIGDNTSTGWAFTNGSDPEFVVNSTGDAAVDGALVSNGGCDLAEAFFGPDDLAPGTVVRIDPTDVDVVARSASAYDRLAVGVVSTRPGLLLNGPHSDFYPLWREFHDVREQVRANPDDEGLERRYNDLEFALDSFPKGNVAVALAGRVPVKVTGVVRAGRSADVERRPRLRHGDEEAGSVDRSGHGGIGRRSGRDRDGRPARVPSPRTGGR